MNHSSSSTVSPCSFDTSFAWKATSIVTSWPFCCPTIAPTTGPCCCRRVCRVMQSVIVSSTSGCSCTVGLVSEARVLETSGFWESPAMIALIRCLSWDQEAEREKARAECWRCTRCLLSAGTRQARGASIRQSQLRRPLRGRPVDVPLHVITRSIQHRVHSWQRERD